MNLDFFIDLLLAHPRPRRLMTSGPNRHPKVTKVEDAALKTAILFLWRYAAMGKRVSSAGG